MCYFEKALNIHPPFSVDGDFIKSNRTKNTSKMLRYLLGLIYCSNTIFGNISGKNELISLYGT